MRIHIIAQPHTQLTGEYIRCAYTSKIRKLCDMLVKDIHGTFVNIKTTNSGMYPIRTIEFISKVKEHYGIGKSFVLVDELFGLLDDEHKSMLNNYGEQVIGTGYKEVGKIEEIKL